MNPLIIYEYTSTSSVTVAIDNSVYDGGMPILYYNIYLDQIKVIQKGISSVAQNNKIEVSEKNAIKSKDELLSIVASMNSDFR